MHGYCEKLRLYRQTDPVKTGVVSIDTKHLSLKKCSENTIE